VRSGPEAAVLQWMRGITPDLSLDEGFTQRTIRDWRSAHPGHRSFTVLRHPVARAHAAFCDKIVATGAGTFPGIRENLRKHFGLDLPKAEAGYDKDIHRAAFLVWLRFLKANLGGQTSLRVDPAWASQTSILQGMAQFNPVDQLLREPEMAEALPDIAYAAGVTKPPAYAGESDPHAQALSQIYDDEVETLTREAYLRDYETFGYGAWGA